MNLAQFYIESLNLEKHPEGGYFKEVYRDQGQIPATGLPEKFDGPRSFSTAIYFLLPGEEISAFHRIKSDEIWHFYSGSAIRIHIIDPDGSYSTLLVGKHLGNNEAFQQVVSAGCWFAAECTDPVSYSLAGCTVAPGFDFNDFELAEQKTLVALFPQHQTIIERFTSQ
jgi:hypothetical protein